MCPVCLTIATLIVTTVGGLAALLVKTLRTVRRELGSAPSRGGELLGWLEYRVAI
jgi:hypothetical protein